MFVNFIITAYFLVDAAMVVTACIIYIYYPYKKPDEVKYAPVPSVDDEEKSAEMPKM